MTITLLPFIAVGYATAYLTATMAVPLVAFLLISMLLRVIGLGHTEDWEYNYIYPVYTVIAVACGWLCAWGSNINSVFIRDVFVTPQNARNNGAASKKAMVTSATGNRYVQPLPPAQVPQVVSAVDVGDENGTSFQMNDSAKDKRKTFCTNTIDDLSFTSYAFRVTKGLIVIALLVVAMVPWEAIPRNIYILGLLLSVLTIVLDVVLFYFFFRAWPAPVDAEKRTLFRRIFHDAAYQTITENNTAEAMIVLGVPLIIVTVIFCAVSYLPISQMWAALITLMILIVTTAAVNVYWAFGPKKSRFIKHLNFKRYN